MHANMPVIACDILAVQLLAVAALQSTQEYIEIAGHASLCSAATMLTAYQFLYFLFSHLCMQKSVGTSLMKHLMHICLQGMVLSAINGVGLSLVIPNAQSITADYHDELDRGKAFGALYMTSALGGAFGSLYATNQGGCHTTCCFLFMQVTYAQCGPMRVLALVTQLCINTASTALVLAEHCHSRLHYLCSSILDTC